MRLTPLRTSGESSVWSMNSDNFQLVHSPAFTCNHATTEGSVYACIHVHTVYNCTVYNVIYLYVLHVLGMCAFYRLRCATIL